MKKIQLLLLLVLVFGMMEQCSTVPLTGRKQLNLLPESELVSMSLTNYNEFLDTNKVSTDRAKVDMVKRVGSYVVEGVKQYLREKGLEDRIGGYEWEFNLVDDDVPNAWCMPGGKVVVYKGILPYTQTEAGLAVVMGHEIAHAIARHGNERMSQSLMTQFGGVLLSTYLDEKPEETKQIFMGAYGLGANVGVLLPFSRTHETEADKIGLMFMAMAGYDPNEALTFWQRMGQAGGQKPPEFLSTHPHDDTRMNTLKEVMPQAMEYYNKAHKR